MYKYCVHIVTGICLLFSLAGCENYTEEIRSREQRAVAAHQAKEPIFIGVAWPADRTDRFIDGLQLAVDEINENGGVKASNRCLVCQEKQVPCGRCQKQGLYCEVCDELSAQCNHCKREQLHQGTLWGRRELKILLEQEAYMTEPDSRRRNFYQQLAYKVADRFIKNKDVIAVIGHPPSAEAVPASVIYQYHGLVFLAPASTNSMLTHPGFDTTFRTIPNNEQMADQLAGYCALNGKFKKMVLLNVRTTYGEELVDSFAKSAAQLGIDIVHRSSFFANTGDFRKIIATFKDKEFDALFLAVSAKPTGALLIKQLREVDITQPIVGGDALYSEALLALSGNHALGVVAPSLYKPYLNTAKPFIEKYKQRYGGREPDGWAAQGYDSIKLLVHIIEKADSTRPSVLANSLRYTSLWMGATGAHSFQDNGEIIGKQYSLNVLRNTGIFEVMPEAHLPYLFHKLAQEGHNTIR